MAREGLDRVLVGSNNISITNGEAMTTTVKLPDSLEAALRQRCEQEGRSISEVMRDALSAYLAREPELDSPWALGQSLFGRHAGPVGLASNRKQRLAEIWDERQSGRGA